MVGDMEDIQLHIALNFLHPGRDDHLCSTSHGMNRLRNTTPLTPKCGQLTANVRRLRTPGELQLNTHRCAIPLTRRLDTAKPQV